MSRVVGKWLDILWFAAFTFLGAQGAIEAVREGRDWSAAFNVAIALICANRCSAAASRSTSIEAKP